MDVREQINALWTEFSRLEEVYRDFAGRYGLSIAELGILHEAWFAEYTTQKSVCELFSSPKQIVYKACRQLLDLGWIRTEKSADDGRYQKIYLTSLGVQKAGPIVTEFASMERTIFLKLGEEDCRQLIRLMKKMSETAAEVMEDEQ